MTTAVQTTPTQSPIAAAFGRAFDRAVANKTIVYKLDAATFVAPSASGGADHTVRVTGSHWTALTCDCKAGQSGKVCHAMAAATFARKYRVYAVKPVAAGVVAPACGRCGSPAVAADGDICHDCTMAAIETHIAPSTTLPTIAPSTDLEIAESVAIAQEIIAEHIAATPVSVHASILRRRIEDAEAMEYAANHRSPNAPSIY